MAIAFRSTNGVGTGTGSGTSSIAVTKPSGVADGDLLVAAFYMDDCTVSTVPDGWTLVKEQEQTGTSPHFFVRVYWKRASSEGANWTWATSANIWYAWEVAAYTGGLASGDPLDGTATSYASSSGNGQAVLPSITTTVDGSMLVAVVGDYAGQPFATGTSPVSNERADANGLCLDDGIETPEGASGAITINTSGSGTYVAGVMLALKPAGSGGTYTRTVAEAATISQSDIARTVAETATIGSFDTYTRTVAQSAVFDKPVQTVTVTRAPTSVAASSGTWSPSVAADQITAVSDYPDASTTKLTGGTSASTINFGFTAFALPANATGITVYVDYYDGEAGSGTNNCAGRLYVGSTNYNASTHNPSGTGGTARIDTWSTNPATSAAWTYDEINGTDATTAHRLNQFGIYSSDSNPTFWIASIRLRVAYTDPAVESRSVDQSAAISQIDQARTVAEAATLSAVVVDTYTRDVSEAATLAYVDRPRTVAETAAVSKPNQPRTATEAAALGYLGLTRSVGEASTLAYSARPRTVAGAASLAYSGLTRAVAEAANLASGEVAPRTVAQSATLSLVATRTVTTSATLSTTGVAHQTYVGNGYSDVTPQQLVRTSDGTLWVASWKFDNYPQGPTSGMGQTLRMYKASSAAAQPASFTRLDSTHEPSDVTEWAIAVDGSDLIHVVYVTRKDWGSTYPGWGCVGDLRYVTFDTTAGTWGTSVQVEDLADMQEIGQGDEFVSLSVDANSVPHIAYTYSDGSKRRIGYRNRVGGTWSARTQVDPNDTPTGTGYTHPGICFDQAGRIVVTFLDGTSIFTSSADGRHHVRVYSGGAWGTTYHVEASSEAWAGIDNGSRLYIDASNRYHLASLRTNSKYVGYYYSDDQGATWSTNHPANQLGDDPASAPGPNGTVRIYAHGTDATPNIVYWQAAGGSAAWGSSVNYIADTSTSYDCSVSVRWSRYFHNLPGWYDVAYWESIYGPNQLYVGVDTGTATQTRTAAQAATLIYQRTRGVSQAAAISRPGVARTAPETAALYYQWTHTVSEAATLYLVLARALEQAATFSLEGATRTVAEAATISAGATLTRTVAEAASLSAPGQVRTATEAATLYVSPTRTVVEAGAVSAPGSARTAAQAATIYTASLIRAASQAAALSTPGLARTAISAAAISLPDQTHLVEQSACLARGVAEAAALSIDGATRTVAEQAAISEQGTKIRAAAQSAALGLTTQRTAAEASTLHYADVARAVAEAATISGIGLRRTVAEQAAIASGVFESSYGTWAITVDGPTWSISTTAPTWTITLS